jgi:para-aminobenzoate synthetase component I
VAGSRIKTGAAGPLSPGWSAHHAAMPEQWTVQPGPSVDFQTALQRVADEPHLLALCGGGQQLLQWGVAPTELRHLDDLQLPPGQAEACTASGWGRHWRGGALVQLDYELPVGPGAWPHPEPNQIRGYCWPLRASVQWSDGRAQVVAADAAGCQALIERLQRPAAAMPVLRVGRPPKPAWDAAGHAWRVECIRELIRAGELYQANLTLPFQTQLEPEPGLDVALFLRLLARSPAGFAALLRTLRGSVISHSPECFLAGDGRQVVSAPIKGTRRRLPGAEVAIRAELLAASKDNAELAMIIDLVRNDLGRVAVVGGVTVPRLPYILDLDYVHHLLAEVRAELPAACTPQALLAASFPPGSITGAPKIRAMQALQELEVGPRGPYCGSFGWLAGNAACSLSVAIRSMVLRDGRLCLHAGGGIVADSDPHLEWLEVQAKLSAMASILETTA